MFFLSTVFEKSILDTTISNTKSHSVFKKCSKIFNTILKKFIYTWKNINPNTALRTQCHWRLEIHQWASAFAIKIHFIVLSLPFHVYNWNGLFLFWAQQKILIKLLEDTLFVRSLSLFSSNTLILNWTIDYVICNKRSISTYW